MKNTITVFRNENKYFISYIHFVSLKKKLDKILKRDNYSKEDSYIVRSLYFDSINNIDFKSKLSGTNIRKKIRLRTYNPKDSKCKLEMKQKKSNLQYKISIWIKKTDATKLIKGDYSVLTKYFEKSEEAILIYKTMVLGCYKPVVMVEYDRIAYVYPRYSTRLTFDMNIRSSETNFNLFSENICFNKLVNQKIVLEIKYNEKLMGFISNILKPYKLTQLAISKYCIGRKIYYEFDF